MVVRLFLFFFLASWCLKAHQLQDNSYEIIVSNGKKGLKDSAGKIIIPPKYDDLGWSNDFTDMPIENIIGYKQNSHWGLITTSNKKITSPEFSFLNATPSNHVIAAKNGRLSQSYFYGLYNAKGEKVLPMRYSSIIDDNGLFIVSERKGGVDWYGLVSGDYQIEIPIEYSKVEVISDFLLALQNADGNFRIYHTNDKKIKIDVLTTYERWNEESIRVYRGLNSGLISNEGEILIPIQYKNFKLNGNHYEVLNYPTWQVFNATNQLLHALIGNDLQFYEDKIILGSERHEELLNFEFESLVPQVFQKILNVKGDKVLYTANHQYGLYDISSKKHILKGFDSLKMEGEFIYSVRKKRNEYVWSIYDLFGIKRTKFEYQEIRNYENRMFAVKRRDHWGFMDRNGKEIIHCVYDSVGNLMGDKMVVSFHKEQGVINEEGDWVVIPRQAKIELLSENRILCRTRNKTTLESIEEELIYFTENKIEFKEGMLWEYKSDSSIVKINLDGTIREAIVSDKKIESTKYRNDEWIAVKINGSYGFIDSNSRLLRISNRYEDVGHARGELISVKILDKWGAIDKDENIVIQPNYDDELLFVNDLAIITVNRQLGLINIEGDVLIAPGLDRIEQLPSGRYKTVKDKKYGLVDRNGRVLINNKYDSLLDLDNGYVIIQKGDKFGVTTIDGVNTIPQIYDKIIYNPPSDAYFALTKPKWELLNDEK